VSPLLDEIECEVGLAISCLAEHHLVGVDLREISNVAVIV